MPTSYTIHRALGLVITDFVGSVTDEQFVELYSTMLFDHGYVLGTHELADLRRVERMDVSANALRRVKDVTRRRYAGSGQSFRTAVLASGGVPFGIGRMYEAFSEEGPERVQVCRDPAEALQWLGLSPDDLELLTDAG